MCFDMPSRPSQHFFCNFCDLFVKLTLRVVENAIADGRAFPCYNVRNISGPGRTEFGSDFEQQRRKTLGDTQFWQHCL